MLTDRDQNPVWIDSAETGQRPDGTSQAAAESEHLLKVAGAVTRDAADVWADLWKEFKGHVTPSGQVMPEMKKGFVPRCGWEKFMERFWLLKHHLDSVSRVCVRK